jgi:hypothetical protein
MFSVTDWCTWSNHRRKDGQSHKERRNTMGDKGGKKDKDKAQKQKAEQQKKKDKKK